MTRWARWPLRTKILLSFSTLIFAVLIATLSLIGTAISNWVEGSLKDQFEVTGKVFNGLMAERSNRLLGEASLLASDFALKRVVVTYDPATLDSVAANQRERIGVDLLWITDEKGVLMGAAGGQARPGLQLTGLAPLTLAMETVASAAAVTELDGELFQLAAVPILGPDPLGYLLAGEALDADTARQLQYSTGSPVSFIVASRLFATSLPATQRDEIFPGGRIKAGQLREQLAIANIAPDSERSTFLIKLSSDRLLSILIPIEASLPEPLFALVQGSYDRALGPLAVLPRWVTVIGAAALLGALLVGRLVANGIAAPMQILVTAMRRVLAGDFRQRVNMRREDEVGFLASSFDDMVAGLEERERIREIFGRFVSHDVATAVLGGQVPLEGERRQVTILFQDVRDFTRLAERTEPPVLVGIVNRLFTEMVAAVEAQGGIVRQFTGDGVMALFGAPVAHHDDPARAVRAALDMVARLPALNAQLEAEHLASLRIGIGIHTGDVVAGRFGPDTRSEYSVFGEAPVLASRIEGLTKELQAPILVSAATAAHLGDEFQLGSRTVQSVKGKQLPVEVMEVLGYATKVLQAG